MPSIASAMHEYQSDHGVRLDMASPGPAYGMALLQSEHSMSMQPQDGDQYWDVPQIPDENMGVT
jgi:hypothetical protein